MHLRNDVRTADKYIYEKSTVRLTSVGLAQARPNYRQNNHISAKIMHCIVIAECLSVRLIVMQSVSVCKYICIFSGPPSIFTLACVDLSEDVSGAVNVTVSWTLSGGDSADFYLINITTNAPQTPYGGLLNITTASVTQRELTGFMADYEYNITVRGICGGQEGSESEPLGITPQGK